ncbi:MAG: PAS domain S-box protein, partial [Desulfobacca sp.]|uniref:PAS domain S-box protein n=1 Tax=Desulfobacca sp. TaxID=2067990 RepID=UPI00404B99C9
MHQLKSLLERINELEELLEISERKADILTNLLKEANAEFEQAIEKVTISEANFRSIFANAPEAIFIIAGQTHEILDSNAFAYQWLGYPPDLLRGMKIDQIMVTAVAYFSRGAPAPGQIQEQRFRMYDGKEVYAEVVSTAVKYLDEPGLLILARDVTERRQLEELSRYKEIFKSGTDPMFINDYQGNILEVNEVACRIFGYRREEFLRLTLKDLTAPQQLQVLRQTRQQIEQGLTIRFEWETLTKTGEGIPFEFHARPITYLGRPAVLSVGRDLSLRRKLEQTLVATARLTAVGEMASGVAHNFNNLLQMIMGATEVALSKLAAGKIRSCQEALQQIQAASQRGSEIVRRIKDFAHTQGSDWEPEEIFPLGDILQEAAELTSFLWKDLTDGCKYDLRLQIQDSCLVAGRPSELYEVIINLLKNALEAMPEGGTVTITAQVVADWVHVSISDTGVGIPPENLERLFQPFFTTKGVQSSGLGLSSSYGIIKRHGGEIQVNSTVGRGTTFTITLPLATGPV